MRAWSPRRGIVRRIKGAGGLQRRWQSDLRPRRLLRGWSRRLEIDPVRKRSDRSLAAVARRFQWEPRPAELEMLADLEQELRRRPGANIVLLLGDRASRLGDVLEAAFPGLSIHRAPLQLPPEDLHVALAATGPYDMIIDDSRRVGIRRRTFRNCWYHLVPGGLYVVRDVRRKPWPEDERAIDPALTPLLIEWMRQRGAPRPDGEGRRALEDWHGAESLGSVTFGTEHLVMENRMAAYAKVRETQMNEVIDRRHDGRAEIIMQLPQRDLIPRGDLAPASLLEDERRFKTRYSAPPMSVRRYRDAVILPLQIAVQDNLILPESYRHNMHPRLTNRGTRELSRYFATLDDSVPRRRLSGRYFHLDAEWRQHYGHLLTEQLSRLWAWGELKRQMPDLKAILSLQKGHSRPHRWEEEIFAAAGVAPEDLVVLDEPVQVEELIGATPMMSMPNYIDPRISDLWDRVGDALAGRGSGPTVDKLFVTRPPDSRVRQCHNQADVEEYFRVQGFEVVRPELLPLAEQVELFRGASVIAGFGGSAMFTLMFRRDPVPLVILRPASYTSVNEYLIGAVRGHRIFMIDSVPDVDHPGGGWSWDAFYSGFTFDFGREGGDLRAALEDLGALV